MIPDVHAGKARLRTLQRRVRASRAERVKELVLDCLRGHADTPAET